jgi:hypothetical protein
MSENLPETMHTNDVTAPPSRLIATIVTLLLMVGFYMVAKER